MDTMMALRAHTRGGPEQLLYEQAPVPVPARGEVLIAVHAAAITFAELGWDRSWTTRDGSDHTPMIPSHELSGTVAMLGEDVTGFSVGDEVYGLIDFDRDGAAAEFATAPAGTLAHKPRSITHVHAAGLPLAALTAWQALVYHAGLVPGEQVLINGGAGGVGVYAVQIAASLGARVIATDVPSHGEFVRRLGAERFIDFTSEAFDEVVSGLDVVLDTVGGSTLQRSYGVLRPGGRLVTLGATPSPERAEEHQVKAMFFVVRPNAEELAHLARMVDQGGLRPVVSQVFPLDAGRRAFESRGRERRPGKTILTVR
ncbi:NADP-dependent oxidoreductase [Actinoallomurus sp. CA-150999]|uniref:NADP-dependent oxidoreductase n=1 Tax=Actinoallomurus sp. CA-150999 TaxID=3239887 RepID=UPI003D906D8D